MKNHYRVYYSDENNCNVSIDFDHELDFPTFVNNVVNCGLFTRNGFENLNQYKNVKELFIPGSRITLIANLKT